ncbi:hypothetical protein [Haliea sp. E17]|uniref:hypothetical protein n=1 Tax=Haliea sp. E17 TaxID=3401576 RepID=UPI003AB07F9C
MDKHETIKREARQSAKRLVFYSVVLGLLIGFGAGLVVADMSIERVKIIYPECSGTKV